MISLVGAQDQKVKARTGKRLGKASTTTTEAAPAVEEYDDDPNYQDGQPGEGEVGEEEPIREVSSEAPTSTTRKTLLRKRPVGQNDDLINALKSRRLHQTKVVKTTPQPPPQEEEESLEDEEQQEPSSTATPKSNFDS